MMRYIIALFFCLLFPYLSAMGQQTDSLRIDTIVASDSSTMTLKDSILFRLKERVGLRKGIFRSVLEDTLHYYTEGVGSTYERAFRSVLEDTLHYYTEGVGSTYERAKENALIMTRKELSIEDYEDLPTLSIIGEDLWTIGKKVYVRLHTIRVVLLGNTSDRKDLNIRATKLTARKMTKSEKKKEKQELEKLKFKYNEKEFRKRMEIIFKNRKESK